MLYVAGCLSQSCCMSLTVYHASWLSLTVSPFPWSSSLSLTVSYGCWLSLTVTPISMKLLHVSDGLLWWLAVSHCLSNRHGFAGCLILFLMVTGCLSLSFPVPRSCCMSLTVSHCCWLSPTVSHGCWLSLTAVPWSCC